jgi:hypothetical protein
MGAAVGAPAHGPVTAAGNLAAGFVRISRHGVASFPVHYSTNVRDH